MSVAVQDIERETSRLPKGNVVLDLDYSTSAVFVMLFLVPAFLLANIIGGPIHTGKEENLAFHFIDWGFYLLQAWVIWIFLLQRSTERLRELFTNISILRFIAFTALGIIGFIITSIIGLIVSDALGIEESESQACYVDFWTCWVMDGIAMIVFAPLFEEVVCRGVLFSWASHRGGIL
jgi:membrane protease YdiL (CAAX protease family)